MIVVSSAAGARLERAEAWLRARPRDDEIVVVGATIEASHRMCLRASDGARFGWHRFTLASLAARIGLVALAGEGLVAIAPLSREAICARIVRQLRGALGPLDRIADAPGLARALSATLSELRLAGVAPEALEERAPFLARLARAEEEELERAGLADRARILRAATASAPGHPLAGRALLLLDLELRGRLEAELVAALAARAPAVFATCPAGDEESLAWLQEVLAEAPVWEPPPAGALGRAQARLFAEAFPPDAGGHGAVELMASPGEAREAVEIARQILAEAERGTPFEEMAVLLRAVEIHREPLREAFRRAQIPAHFSKGTMKPDPGGRALLALLACRAERFSASRFAEYLSLSVVPELEGGAPPPRSVPFAAPDDEAFVVDEPSAEPDADEDSVAIVAPRAWERLLVDAAVVGRDRARWRRRIDGLAASLSSAIAKAEDEAEAEALRTRKAALDGLAAFALPLLDDLAALPERASWQAWLSALEKLAVRSIRKPSRVLEVLVELAPLGAVGPVDLDEVRLVLEERLTRLVARAHGARAGKVYVASVAEARGQRFAVVFAPGLAERVFPPVVREDPLLLDEARKALDPRLAVQAVRVARERLALRLVAGAAERRLVVSYPRLDDDKGRARVPSFYGLEILRAAEGKLPRFDELPRRALPGAADRMGWPAPRDPALAIDAAEFDLALLERLITGESSARAGAAAYLLDASPHLARALRFRALRWQPRWSQLADGFSAQGTRAHPGAKAALSRRQPAIRPHAPTSLELFARCPYRFYLRAVAGVLPREETGDIEQLDPRQRGELVHGMQRSVIATLRAEGFLPFDRARESAILARASAVISEVAERWREDHAPAIDRVYRDTIDEIAADMRSWLLDLVHGSGWQPAHAELAFGLCPDAAHDPESRPDPVTIEGIRLRGAIDLVERKGDALRATDHKTGKPSAPPGFVIAGGRILQPVLYALALEQLLPEAVVVSGRLSHATTRGGFVSLEVPLDDAARGAIRRFASKLAEAFEKGFFPAAPEAGGCILCDYRMHCGPYEEQRTKAKKPRLRLIDDLRSER